MKLYDREKVFDILRINWVQTTKKRQSVRTMQGIDKI